MSNQALNFDISANSLSSFELSLQFLIDTLILLFFKDTKCVININSFPITPTHRNISYLLHNNSCLPDCYSYIQFINELKEEYDHELQKCLQSHNFKYKRIAYIDKNYLINHTKATVQNVLIVKHSVFIMWNKTSQNFDVIGYNSWNVDKTTILDQWSIKENRFLNGNVNYIDYLEDKTRDMTKSSIIYHTQSTNTDGPSALMWIEIAHMLKLKITFVNDYKYVSSFENPIISFIPTTYRYHFISYPISTRMFSFYVPKRRIYIDKWTIIYVFSLNLWLALTVSYFLGMSYFWLKWKTERFRQNASISPLTLLGLYVLQCVPNHQLPCQTKDRFVLSLILILTIMIVSQYGSGLVKTMVTPSYESDIRTMEDLANSELPVIGYSLFGDFDSQTSLEQKITKRSELLGYGPMPFNLISNQTPQVVYSIVSEIGVPLDDYGHKNNQLMKPFTTVYYLLGVKDPNLYIHSDNILRFLYMFREHGLLKKLEWQYILNRKTVFEVLEKLDNAASATKPRILNIGDFGGTFIIWGIGVLFSVIILITENLIYNFSKFTNYLHYKLHYELPK